MPANTEASVEDGYVDTGIIFSCGISYIGDFVITQTGCSFTGAGGEQDTVNGPRPAVQIVSGTFSGNSANFKYECTGCTGSANGTMTFDGSSFAGTMQGDLAGPLYCMNDSDAQGKTSYGWITLTPIPEPPILDHGMTHGLDSRNNPLDHVTSFLTTDAAAYGFLLVGPVAGSHTVNLNFKGGPSNYWHLESPPITLNADSSGGNWIADFGLRIARQLPTDPDPTQLIGSWTCQILLDGTLVETESFFIEPYCARCNASVKVTAPPRPVNFRGRP